MKIDVVIAVAWSEDEQCFYAWSPQLGCVRDGDTIERALAICQEAIEVRIESLIERGTLKDYLLSNGYTVLEGSGGEEHFNRPMGTLYDQSSAQTLTGSNSISVAHVEEVVIQPEVRVVGAG